MIVASLTTGLIIFLVVVGFYITRPTKKINPLDIRDVGDVFDGMFTAMFRAILIAGASVTILAIWIVYFMTL